MELRKLARYRLDLPAIFRWTDHCGNQQIGGGFTRDISPMSTFIFSNDFPPCSATIHCEVLLPKLRKRGCAIETAGHVFRVEHGFDWREEGFVIVGDMLLISKGLPQTAEVSELLARPKKPLN